MDVRHCKLNVEIMCNSTGTVQTIDLAAPFIKLKKQLIKLKPEIEQSQKDTAKLMEQVEKDQEAAAVVQAQTAVEEQKATAASAEANGIKDSVQKDLDEALPEYYAAIKALDSLNKQDITEVKTFTKPPPLVELVM